MTREIKGEVANSYLTVEKQIESTNHEQTLVTFTVTSTSGLPIAFRLVDPLPAGLSIDDIEFHADHKRDHWTAHTEEAVAFSDTLSPDETVGAFYYLDTDRVDASTLPRPTIEKTVPVEADTATTDAPPDWRDTSTGVDTARTVTDGPLPTGLPDGTINQSGKNATDNPTEQQRHADAGGTDGQAPVTHPREDATVASSQFAELQAEYDQVEYAEFRDDVDEIYPDEVEFKELLLGDADSELPAAADPMAPDETGSDDEPPQGSASTAIDPVVPEENGAAGARSNDPGVLPKLLQELQEHDLSEDEQQLLQEALGVAAPHHTTVKVRHLQTKVADLEAYIDALETFLDDNGTAGEVLRNLEDELSEVTRRLGELESAGDDRDDRQAAFADRLATVEDRIEAVSELRSDVDQLREESRDVRDHLDRVEEAVERVDHQMETKLKALEDLIDRQGTELESLEQKTSTIDQQYEQIVTAFTSTIRTDADSAPSDPET